MVFQGMETRMDKPMPWHDESDASVRVEVRRIQCHIICDGPKERGLLEKLRLIYEMG